MKYLIINADDFGLSREVNSAVAKAHKRGTLTSTSLMVNEKAAKEALAIARDNPSLGVGLHLSLIQGIPALSTHEIASIVNSTGCFFTSPVFAGLRFFFISKCKKALKKEIEAQILKFLNSGLTPTHVDGHLNIHLHPSVLLILLPLMDKYNIKAIRVPTESLIYHISIAPDNIASKVFHGLVFALLGKWARKVLDSANIVYPDRTYGLLQSGNMTKKFIQQILEKLKHGFTEMSFHIATEPLPPGVGACGYRYREELETLLDSEIGELIKKSNIHLANYYTLRKIKQGLSRNQ